MKYSKVLSGSWKCVLTRQPLPSSARWFSTPSSSKLVDVTVNDKTGVSTVTLQRPPVNSLNLELLQEFTTVLKQLGENKSRGMILTSASPTVFSAGLDITEMYKPNIDRFKAFWTALQDMWLTLFVTPYPTVAAINGHSPAGGCLLAISCDYRVMVGPQYTIGLNETQLGIVAPEWVQDSYRNVLSPHQAELTLTTGYLYKTQEAYQVGLIDEVASDKADAIQKSEAFLASTSKIPKKSRALTKQSCRQRLTEIMRKKRDEDLQFMLENLLRPDVENQIEIYLMSLKKKK